MKINVTGLNIQPIYLEARHETKYAWSTWDKSVKLLGFEHKIDWVYKRKNLPIKIIGEFGLGVLRAATDLTINLIVIYTKFKVG